MYLLKHTKNIRWIKKMVNGQQTFAPGRFPRWNPALTCVCGDSDVQLRGTMHFEIELTQSKQLTCGHSIQPTTTPDCPHTHTRTRFF